MRIVVVGASRLGRATIKALLEKGHDAVLVDKSAERLDAMADELDCGMIEGDGTFPQILTDAFGDGADGLLLMTNHDDVNILAAVVGRSIGYERVTLQIVRPELLSICEELGLEDIVTPHVTVSQSIIRSLEDDADVWTQLDATDDLHFGRYDVPADLDGQTLGALDLPGNARAVAVLEDGKQASTDPDTSLAEGQTIVIATSQDHRGALDEVFSGTRKNS
ncbi:potassium channel family protein [Pseudaestuariivita sp.]|uniref:potassium channel family protein n=1 Tax=Pseudaestuariivita sp. TaxID=2211669 RepID=UPI0040596B93